MMRKIKFRAWIESQNRMERTIEISPFHVGDCDRFRWNHGEVELMQYTGLKDKNGVAIYEGDIVQTSYISPLSKEPVVDRYEIKENENSLIKMLHSSGLEKWHRYLYLQFKEVEVIGNIFEHPQLLEDKR